MEQNKVFPTRLAAGSFILLLLILVLVHVTLFQASTSLEEFSTKDIPTLQLSGAATRVLSEIEFLSSDVEANRDRRIIREHVLEKTLTNILVLSDDTPEARRLLLTSEAYQDFLRYRRGELSISERPDLFVKLKIDLQQMVERYVTLKNKSLSDQRIFVMISAVVSLVGAVFFFGLIFVIYRRYQQNLSNFRSVSENLEKERLVSIQSAKLASLGEMAAGLAHEINNPLAVILGKGEILLEKVQANSATDTEIMKSVGKINDMALRISKIVMSMKKISRGGLSQDLTSVNLLNVIDDVLILVSQKLRNANVSLDKSAVDPFCCVVGNFSHLNQVLINLLNNAADELSRVEEEPKVISLSSRQEGGFVYLTVRDSGPGIPTSVKEKLFQPFFTTKEVGKGTGLGLSLSRGLMKDMGGDLYLEEATAETCFVMKMRG